MTIVHRIIQKSTQYFNQSIMLVVSLRIELKTDNKTLNS